MTTDVKTYLAEIGRRGGQKSRRTLTAAQARDMVAVREARRAFRDFQQRCFWWCDPAMRITSADVAWVEEQLRKHGGREAWLVAERLCR